MSSRSLYGRKGKEFWEIASSLLNRVLVALISMPINKHESQGLVARGNLLPTNHKLSQCVLVCLRVHLLGPWSPTIKAARLHIKSYRLLFISPQSKEYISLRTDLKASDSLELNFYKNSKVIDLWLNQNSFILSVGKFCTFIAMGN